MSAPLHIVTGAFGYSGQYITRRLLAAGCRVRTLTNSPGRRNPFGKAVEVHPLNFDRPDQLAESLRGARALHNTYWVRFNHRTFTFADAVRNTLILFEAAKATGMPRVVHVSITNPDEHCDLEYFRGKAILEKALMGSGLSYAILRPAVLFGKEDILINNIAWLLRRAPFFGVFGDGRYKLQPIYVDDLAALAVDQAARIDNTILNAIGPETFTYRGLAEQIGQLIGKPRKIISIPATLGYLLAKCLNPFLHDVLITRDEIRGLMQNRLYVPDPQPPLAITKLTDWTRDNRNWLGSRYASELGRRMDRVHAYIQTSTV